MKATYFDNLRYEDIYNCSSPIRADELWTYGTCYDDDNMFEFKRFMEIKMTITVKVYGRSI